MKKIRLIRKLLILQKKFGSITIICIFAYLIMMFALAFYGVFEKSWSWILCSILLTVFPVIVVIPLSLDDELDLKKQFGSKRNRDRNRNNRLNNDHWNYGCGLW
jgi:magnesium-transporting ATPase (P-type)